MIRKLLLTCSFLFSSTVVANAPSYFNKEIDSEYRALIQHVKEMMPETNLQLAYLPSFYPYSLLDIRPTKFKSDKDKQAFANFNFGVFGRALLNINKGQLSSLPNISICKEMKCENERIVLIKKFVKESDKEIKSLLENKGLFIIQQTTPHVYRVNNTFFSPTQLITYYPSKKAGFVPSGDYKVSTPDDEQDLMNLSSSTQALRDVMAKYKVAAITKENKAAVNVIFGGIGDNHWGVVFNHKYDFPSSGEYNDIGLEYDIIQKISDESFYYQTN
ncbi:hypothetical protein [Pseudoalteromonas sp. SK18]|uniref:hypothetical protein n=1 Tax=Pseudoalteromonas sp. SK18 TaxID=1938366 RepID=UPI0020C99B5A|nr:hypothetical protein [Pseudoalteromonas sp. SK18]